MIFLASFILVVLVSLAITFLPARFWQIKSDHQTAPEVHAEQLSAFAPHLTDEFPGVVVDDGEQPITLDEQEAEIESIGQIHHSTDDLAPLKEAA